MSRSRPKSEALALLGLARRAGGAIPGTAATRRALRAGQARLVLTAGDASPTQLKKVLGLLRNRSVPHRVVADRSTLGTALGTPPVSTVAVTNPSLARQILEELSARQRPERDEVRDTGGS